MKLEIDTRLDASGDICIHWHDVCHYDLVLGVYVSLVLFLAAINFCNYIAEGASKTKTSGIYGTTKITTGLDHNIVFH